MSSVKSKKRKAQDFSSNDVDTTKPTAVFQPSKGRPFTVSVALPGSIIANAQSHELKTTLAGQIARALAVFSVDEVIIFDDGQAALSKRSQTHQQASDDGYNGYANPNRFLAHLLSYLETPPHLRKHLFPIHPDLRTAGTLPSLDMPHHLRAHEWCRYREGVSMGAERDGSGGMRSYVEVGLESPVVVQAEIPEYARVTVKFAEESEPAGFQAGGQVVEAVHPSVPRRQAGYYWGFQVREAESLSAVLTECEFEGGYDLTWGTSERGEDLAEVLAGKGEKGVPKAFRHMCLVFGGVAGLEVAVKADQELVKLGVEKPEKLFDFWVNLHPGQGSRTIRTEEAVWLGLMGLRGFVKEHGAQS